ncbi:hypothetical protein FCI23_52320 [Actinacidiphila oryziradicis]|uniref:Uncharacterized protein n=1 Tax=Actinacidiphila oryziradicis TaxID=2571141 RepID=A0A4U0RI25_9ACTN|nr:hypothetical protein FCI23_52320 [Actinacidiphila oryziradicis]
MKRGCYQFNPPYSYRVAEFIPGTETAGTKGKGEYVKVEQYDTITKIRNDANLPDLVRFPSLESMRQAIEKLRQERAEERAVRRLERAQRQEEGVVAQ